MCFFRGIKLKIKIHCNTFNTQKGMISFIYLLFLPGNEEKGYKIKRTFTFNKFSGKQFIIYNIFYELDHTIVFSKT